MAKNGEQHIASLRDGRQIFLDGALIENHVEHPAFCGSIRSVAAMYDFQARPENLRRMTFLSPTTGSAVSRMWQLPESYAELVERRSALEAWAEHFVRLSGPVAGSCCLGALRNGDGGGAVSRPRGTVCAVAGGVLRVCARQRSLPDLRDHQSAGRPEQEHGRAGGQVACSGRGGRGCGRHYAARGEDAGDRLSDGQRGDGGMRAAAAAGGRDDTALRRWFR